MNGFGNPGVDCGFSIRYAHITDTAASLGVVATAGQVICYVGSTDDPTENYLHFEVSVSDILTDPLGYVTSQ